MSAVLATLVRERCRAIRAENAENVIDGAERAFAVLSTVEGLRDRREHFVALYLDVRNVLRGKPYVVSVGTASASLVHPREVFAEALRRNASALIVSHNHPSGDPSPSPDDLAVTRRLRQAGELLGIQLRDHIIVGADCYESLAERGEL